MLSLATGRRARAHGCSSFNGCSRFNLAEQQFRTYLDAADVLSPSPSASAAERSLSCRYSATHGPRGHPFYRMPAGQYATTPSSPSDKKNPQDTKDDDSGLQEAAKTIGLATVTACLTITRGLRRRELGHKAPTDILY
ncbi:hypothetical protein J3458_009226 [Metarhizium acridum]|uniref:uncharacterized protein n=1 Tax=Metarhizium acridum TaxID=92637 RepID=UPI001C6CB87F|nr:hypothetical protein J3458_009226 [Metarhizium acridum]